MKPPREKFKIVWFENEMLPKWAQVLDVAAQLSRVPEGTRGWFSRFTNSAGVDDSRTIVNECQSLLTAIRKEKAAVIRELERTRGDGQAPQIVAAWEYALDTMIQEARSKKTCSWRIEGIDNKAKSDHGDGDITLRRV
jgi:hypothetical protein